VVELRPGTHEFADRWSLSFAPGERGVDLSKLFAVLLADAAILGDSFLLDEIGLVGGGQRTAGDMMKALLSSTASSESTALSVLGALRDE
jgi:hypothetical protein